MIYFDTNVLVAAVLANHPHHREAEAALQKVHSGDIRGSISSQGLAEFYAALTRIPITPPVYPGEAWQIIERDVLPHYEIVWMAPST